MKNKENTDDPNKELISHMRTLLVTPDSLRSEEDKELLKYLESVLYERLIVSDGKLKITIDKEEWKAKGLNEAYYDMMKKNVEDINNIIDTTIMDKQLILDAFLKSQAEYKERENDN